MMIGWVVVIGIISFELILMVLLIFMWILLYFWVFVIFVKFDYGCVGVLMLIEIYGCWVICNNIFGYMVVLLLVLFGIVFILIGGWIYFVIVIILNLWFFYVCVKVWCWDEEVVDVDEFVVEKLVFKVLLVYLFLYFVVLLI